MIAKSEHAISDFFAVSHPRFPSLSRKGLRAMETEHAEIAEVPCFSSIQLGADGMGSIFDHAIPRSIATSSSLFICISLFSREQLSPTTTSWTPRKPLRSALANSS
jgi:hypothetical protein